MNRGLWNALESMEVPAAVLAGWQRLIVGEFSLVRGFIQPTQELALCYPCLAEVPCGCCHEVVPIDEVRWIARCTCDEGDCAAPRLTPTDLIVYELDAARFGGAVARTLGFEAAEDTGAIPGVNKIWPVGIHAATRLPVYLAIAPSAQQLHLNLEMLAASRPGPFILLAPTTGNRLAMVNAFLTRQHCAFIPLEGFVALDGPGKFRVTASVQPILDQFAAGLAGPQTIAPMLDGIRREIASVRDDRRELRGAKARLEEMHGEGLFGFAKKIDREARDQFFAILIAGDTAKACRALGMKDSTLRSKIAKWRQRGKAYVALAEFLRWRKSINGEAGVEIAKRVASGAEREIDHAALLRDAIEELESFNPDNWDEKCADLAEALRTALS